MASGFAKNLLLTTAMIAFLSLCVHASANDSSYEGSGTTVYQVKETRVRMVNENIDIRRIEKDRGTRRWQAECEFTFENLADQPTEIQMGFPDWNINEYEDNASRKRAIENFQVMIEGKAIDVEYKRVEQKKGKKRVMLPGGGNIPYDAAYTWPVRFEPRQMLVVKNTYSFGGFSTVGGFWDSQRQRYGFPSAMPRLTRADVFWTGRESERGGIDFDQSAYSVAMYIVTTGLSWSGPIGHAKISIDMPTDCLPNRVVPAPRGYRVENGRVVWEFTDWRPKSEVALYVLMPLGEDGPDMRVFGSADEAHRWVAWAKKNSFDRESIGRLKNAYFARRGHEFDNSKLASYFERLSYKKVPGKKVAMADLTADEQAAVAALEEFEKSFKSDR